MDVAGSAASLSTNEARPTVAARVSVALRVLDRAAPWLLAAFLVGYFFLFTAMGIYWRDHLRWGFDIIVYSQPIWNTAHGHIWEVSIYNWTHTELGHDFEPLELPLALLYRLLGGNIALILAQTASITLGGLGVYALARHVMPKLNRVVPLLFAVLYLTLFFIQNANLEKFHIRNMIMWTFFFAWLGFRTNRTWLIWLMLALAITSRSDVALIVLMFGFVCLLDRRRWTQSWLLMAFGAAWFIFVVYILVPHFSTVGFVYDENYQWLGGSLSGIIRSTLTRPVYVAHGVLTAAKLRYTFDLLFPFLFLPLLKPRILLIPLPIYLLNILSDYQHQFTVQEHYQALIIPWLAIATIEALGDLVAGRGFVGTRLRPFAVRCLRVIARRPSLAAVADPPLLAGAVVTLLIAVMFACSAAQQLTTQCPVVSYLRHHGPNPRADAGRALIAEVPRTAPLAITQKLAGNTPDRRYIYSFPGDPLYHGPELIDRADYLIGDEQLSDFEQQQIARYRTDPAWQVVDERGGFILMKKRNPGSGA